VARVQASVRTAALAALGLLCAARAPAAGEWPAAPPPEGSTRDALAVLDPPTLVALEARGLRFADVVGASTDDARALAGAPFYASLVATLSADLTELAQRDGVGRDGARDTRNNAFRASWLTDRRARFELVGVVNRLDRQRLAPSRESAAACGEVRLVYRLALAPRGRPPARLPMTVSLAFPQRDVHDGRDARAACAEIAHAWLSIPRSGRGRLDALMARIRSAAALAEVEVDVQTLHGEPSSPDQDDHAEYLLRGFDIVSGSLVPKPLLGTPREDLNTAERAALALWVRDNFEAIDAGAARLPEALSATRAFSVTPRGLARPENRPFSRLLGDAPALAGLPYEHASAARTPVALLRRLDESTCQGCHATRSIAGFHLLGAPRGDGAGAELAVGASPHMLGELAWRRRWLERAATPGHPPVDVSFPPAPFTEVGGASGAKGAPCGLGDAAFASWTCGPGLHCADADGTEVGACAPAQPTAGDACEEARVIGSRGVDGDRLALAPPAACGSASGREASCGTAEYGFAGGLCAEGCPRAGEALGDLVCAAVPHTGYESECFFSREPIERCLARHTDLAWLSRCDLDTPCRSDYACVHVAGTPPGTGGCAPPYFVFETRVDGPRLDR
jgi:hypothetical protein